MPVVPATAHNSTPGSHGEGLKPWGAGLALQHTPALPGLGVCPVGMVPSSRAISPPTSTQPTWPLEEARQGQELWSTQQPRPALPGMCTVPGEAQHSTRTAQSEVLHKNCP